MKNKRNIIIIVVVVLVIGGLIAGRTLLKGNTNPLTADLQTEVAQKGSLEAFVGGTGTVRSNQDVTLSWQTSGTVESVYAELGEEVVAGEILAELSTSSLPQNVILARADLEAAQEALEDLYDSYGPLPQALAQQAVADARDELDTAEDEWESIFYTGTEKEIKRARRIFEDALDALKFIEDHFGKEGIKYRRAYQAYSYALAHYNYVSGNTVNEIEEAQYAANLEVATQQLADAEEEYQRLLAGPTPEKIGAAEARVAAAEATLQQAWIEAPFAGTVTMANPLPGDQVSVGDLAFRIDDLTRLLVNVQISEVDINRVVIGQPATLNFDAILDVPYTGEVVEVSPVGMIEEGLVNFEVTIALTDFDEAIKPGMTAAVNIRVEQLEDVLLVPNRAVRVDNGQRVVYILSKSGEIEMVEIELGSTSDVYSEVAGGELQIGDEIILNPPTSLFGSMNGGPGGGPFGGN